MKKCKQPAHARAELTEKKCTGSASQSRGDLFGDRSRSNNVARSERDGRHPRVPSTSVLLAQRSEVHFRRSFFPWIGSHRNFRARGRSAHAYSVKRIRKQIVRNEFVVA